MNTELGGTKGGNGNVRKRQICYSAEDETRGDGVQMPVKLLLFVNRDEKSDLV
jgi:hypothetical protein